MTAEIIDLLRRKPWRSRDHRHVFSEFALALGQLIAPPSLSVRPPRIHTLP